MEIVGRYRRERASFGLDPPRDQTAVPTRQTSSCFPSGCLAVGRHSGAIKVPRPGISQVSGGGSLGSRSLVSMGLPLFSGSQVRGRLALGRRPAPPQYFLSEEIYEDGDSQATQAPGSEGGLVLFFRLKGWLLRDGNSSRGPLLIINYPTGEGQKRKTPQYRVLVGRYL